MSPRLRGIVRSSGGFTLTEMVSTMLVLSIVMITMTALMVATLRSYAHGSNLTYAYMDTNRALEWVARDVRKSILATIDPSGTKMILTMPLVDTSTGFLKQPLQTDGHPVTYYLGDENANQSPSGTLLWRETLGTGRRSLITAVAGAKFSRAPNPFGTNMNLIEITLTARRGENYGQESRTLTTRASVRN